MRRLLLPILAHLIVLPVTLVFQSAPAWRWTPSPTRTTTAAPMRPWCCSLCF